jgi:5-hydroxyisourate hydrolase
MSGLSIHAVDVAEGRPAAGLDVEVRKLGPAPIVIARGTLGANGALDHPVTAQPLAPGDYEVRLHVGVWLGPERAGILETIVFALRLRDPGQHCHLPFKFTPWGYSVFRGS